MEKQPGSLEKLNESIEKSCFKFGQKGKKWKN
jgi:hypothetical protein